MFNIGRFPTISKNTTSLSSRALTFIKRMKKLRKKRIFSIESDFMKYKVGKSICVRVFHTKLQGFFNYFSDFNLNYFPEIEKQILIMTYTIWPNIRRLQRVQFCGDPVFVDVTLRHQTYFYYFVSQTPFRFFISFSKFAILYNFTCFFYASVPSMPFLYCRLQANIVFNKTSKEPQRVRVKIKRLSVCWFSAHAPTMNIGEHWLNINCI